MIKYAGVLTSMILILVVMNGCATGEPDFVGYVVAKTKGEITIVEQKEDPFVLIRKNKKFQIGDKVEVWLKGKGVEDIFPSNAPAVLKKVKVPDSENDVVNLLLSDLFSQHGLNYYTVVLEVIEQPDEWLVKTIQYDNSGTHEHTLNKNYKISLKNMEIIMD